MGERRVLSGQTQQKWKQPSTTEGVKEEILLLGREIWLSWGPSLLYHYKQFS